MIYALAVSLLLTLVLEAGFYHLASLLSTAVPFNRLALLEKRDKHDLYLVLLVNIITNPAVVLTYWLAAYYTSFDLVLTKTILEVLAVITESYYYKKYGRSFKHPLLFSVCANLFSYACGVIWQRIF